MVKVNYASLQTQSSTMSSASQSRVAGFNQLISAFDSFGGSGGELIGTGYDAARAYATSVMSPYYKGCILYSEAVADAANTLADSYAAKCGAENLDEEQLQAEIDSATRGCMSLSASISGLQSKSKPAAGDAARISSLQNQLTAAQNQLTAAQEKLDNLRAFSAESPSACASADGYQGLVSKAMSGISVSFGGGGFALPEDLTWVSDVEQGWADREIAMENNYLSALDKVYNGESLTEAELTAIERYAAAYPDRVDSSVLEYVQKARQVKAEEMKIRVLIDKVDEGKSLTDEETKTLQDYQSNHPDSNLLENVKYALDQNAANKSVENGKQLSKKKAEEETLLQQAQNLLDDARKSDLYQRFIMLYKLYPKNVVEKILKNDAIVELINSSKNREGIYKLIKSYSELGDKSLKLGKWTISANSIGKKIDSFNKGLGFLLPTTTIKQTVTEFVKNSNVYKTLSKNAWLGKSAKFLGKASTFLTVADMAITYTSSAMQEFSESGHVGKAVAVGALDTIKSIGPLEGATIGSMFGPVGTAVGFGLGAVNTVVQMVNPHLYSDIKKGTKQFIDDASKVTNAVGKATEKAVSNIVGGASKMFSGFFGG